MKKLSVFIFFFCSLFLFLSTYKDAHAASCDALITLNVNPPFTRVDESVSIRGQLQNCPKDQQVQVFAQNPNDPQKTAFSRQTTTNNAGEFFIVDAFFPEGGTWNLQVIVAAGTIDSGKTVLVENTLTPISTTTSGMSPTPRSASPAPSTPLCKRSQDIASCDPNYQRRSTAQACSASGGGHFCALKDETVCEWNGEFVCQTGVVIAPTPPCKDLNPNGTCKTFPTAIGDVPTDPMGFIKRIFGFLLGLSGGIAVVLIIIGGYQLMTSQGNKEAVQGARDRITSAIVGLLFLIFSLVILQVIGVDILSIPGFQR